MEDFQADHKETVQEDTTVVDEQLVTEFISEIVKESASVVIEDNLLNSKSVDATLKSENDILDAQQALIEGAEIVNSLVDTYLTEDSCTEGSTPEIILEQKPNQEDTTFVDEQLVTEFISEIIKESSSLILEDNLSNSLSVDATLPEENLKTRDILETQQDLVGGATIINSLVDIYLTTGIDATDSDTDPAYTIMEDFQTDHKETVQEDTPVVDEQLVTEFITEIIKESASLVTEDSLSNSQSDDATLPEENIKTLDILEAQPDLIDGTTIINSLVDTYLAEDLCSEVSIPETIQEQANIEQKSIQDDGPVVDKQLVTEFISEIIKESESVFDRLLATDESITEASNKIETTVQSDAIYVQNLVDIFLAAGVESTVYNQSRTEIVKTADESQLEEVEQETTLKVDKELVADFISEPIQSRTSFVGDDLTSELISNDYSDNNKLSDVRIKNDKFDENATIANSLVDTCLAEESCAEVSTTEMIQNDCANGSGGVNEACEENMHDSAVDVVGDIEVQEELIDLVADRLDKESSQVVEKPKEIEPTQSITSVKSAAIKKDETSITDQNESNEFDQIVSDNSEPIAKEGHYIDEQLVTEIIKESSSLILEDKLSNSFSVDATLPEENLKTRDILERLSKKTLQSLMNS